MSGCLPATRTMSNAASAHLPTHMRALAQGHTPGQAALRSDVRVPSCGDGQVLVRIMFAGQNASDSYALDAELAASYRHPDYVLGSDFCGHVVQTKADAVPLGAAVCGWLPGGCSHRGAYAQYAVCDADMLIRMPSDRSVAQMAALPFSFFTAAHALTFGLGLDVEQPRPQGERIDLVLVWGAGTACGFYAAQLLQRAGYGVVAVAGKDAITRLEQAGVQGIMLNRDQGDPAYIAKLINTVCPGGVSAVLDCTASAASIAACIQCVDNGGGAPRRVHTLLPAQRALADSTTAPQVPTNVSLSFALVHSMLRPTQPPLSILSIQDDHFSMPDMLAAQHAFAVRWASYDRGHLYTMLRDGTLHLLPVVQWPPTLKHGFGLRGVQQALRCASATDEALPLPRGKTVHSVQNELHLNIAATEAAPVKPLQYSP